mgnify:CR=1 FL=1
MPAKKKFFKISDVDHFFYQAALWANQYDHFCLLQPSQQKYPHGTFQRMLAADAQRVIKPKERGNFQYLNQEINNNKNWLFGHLTYDLKNETEDLNSLNKARVAFPEISFFQPRHLISEGNDGVYLESDDAPEDIFEKILRYNIALPSNSLEIDVMCDTTREQYIDTVEKLKHHIEEGDIYEINYCINYYGKIRINNSVTLFQELMRISPNPFSAFYKVKDKYALCASPERFLKKRGDKIISQPIKGPSPRGTTHQTGVAAQRILHISDKERAENMIIVDLVRNDLAKSFKSGSVKVEEMFGIYTFPQLHQMISTVTGILKDDKTAVEAIKNAFPMGSMTGAPKIKVMELIEKYERSKRSLFSGSIGYFTPDNDFDFNVIIRSLMIDTTHNLLSYSVGSAITYDSQPLEEFQECNLKAQAIQNLLTGKNKN